MQQSAETRGRSAPVAPALPRPAPRFEHTLPGLGDGRCPARRGFRAEVRVDPLNGALPRCWTVTEDISRRGMFVAAPRQYPLHTLLRLTLLTEHGELALKGRVVHRLEGVGFGCKFVELGRCQRDALGFLVGMSRQHRKAVPALT